MNYHIFALSQIRVPAWTDRILFKIEDEDINATLHSYEAIDSVDSSDHKPVKAHLCLKVNKMDHSFKSKISQYEQV